MIRVFPSTLQKLFIDRAFAIFDRQKNGRIVVDEYIETLAQLAGKNADTAIEFLFRIYDINGDGSLDMGELKEVLKASIADSGMTFDEQANKSIIHIYIFLKSYTFDQTCLMNKSVDLLFLLFRNIILRRM